MKHQTKKTRSAKSTLPLAVCLCYLAIATFLVGGMSFSHFAATTDGGDSATIALMASDLDITLDEDLTPKQPGETRLVKLNVTNVENGVTCEVSQKYTLSAATVFGNLPLTFTFYTDNGGTQGTAIGTTATGEFMLSAGAASADYWLEITWPADQDGWNYALELDVVRVTAIAEQID